MSRNRILTSWQEPWRQCCGKHTFVSAVLQTWSPGWWTLRPIPGWKTKTATTLFPCQRRTRAPGSPFLSRFLTWTLSSAHSRSGRSRIRLFSNRILWFWFSQLFSFPSTKDATRQVCSPAALRDQKAPQTDAQHRPLVHNIHQGDHNMWWVTVPHLIQMFPTFPNMSRRNEGFQLLFAAWKKN